MLVGVLLWLVTPDGLPQQLPALGYSELELVPSELLMSYFLTLVNGGR